ncbi:MAG: methyltransferase domain-containing protein [Clostridia bacterium]|nr:methyltransferase domain-containing protein [Clostridia bacterium]
MYTAFARVYDALMDSVDYPAWARHYQHLMDGCGVPNKGKLVECACGTGGITLPLKAMGYSITGIDLSEDMLAVAMEKARAAGLTVPFVRQDMTHLAVPGRVHAVLATCDGVNYLTEPAQVKAFFFAAHAALRPGGALIFDVSTPDKLTGDLGDHTLFSDDEQIAYIWRNHYEEKTACVRLDLSLFVRRPDGAYDRMEEHQIQRAHSRAELRAWLKEAGFADVHFYGRQRLTPPRPGDDRWHVTAVKETA